MSASMRILLVENDPVLRRALCDFLAREGIQIIAQSANGDEALSALAQLHPDLILTDCDMPGCGGIELVQRLRAQGDQTPVVMLSGQTEPAVQASATAAGVNRFLLKPVLPAMLSTVLRQTCYSSAA